MNKKVIFIVAVLFLAASVSVFSWGIGAAFGYNIGGAGAMLSLKLDETPLYFGLGLTASSDYFNLGVTADYHFLQGNLSGILNYYIGAGAYIDMGSSNREGHFNLGARLPLALYIFPLEQLEVFLEIAPALGIGIVPLNFPDFNIHGALGFRYWFN